jgi:hypothetical protein
MSYYGRVFNRDDVINRTQTSGPISEFARMSNAEVVELCKANMEAEKLAMSISDECKQIIDGFNDVANMTAEQEAEMNAAILAELGA